MLVNSPANKIVESSVTWMSLTAPFGPPPIGKLSSITPFLSNFTKPVTGIPFTASKSPPTRIESPKASTVLIVAVDPFKVNAPGVKEGSYPPD